VPPAVQRRVLFWGVLGALVMRGIMIVAGVALVERFSVVLAVFGLLLVVSGVRMARQREEEVRPGGNRLSGLMRRLVPVTDGYDGDWFFVRRGGRLMATPLLVVLLTIESSDLVFALDSVPAVARRLCEAPRTGFAAGEAFGCQRSLRPTAAIDNVDSGSSPGADSRSSAADLLGGAR
jgi:predicted tellurium resistance membrane protein TerC